MALIVVALQVVRLWVTPRAHDRLAERYHEALAAASDEAAARLVARLAVDDDQWLDLLVAATTDARPLVSQAAEAELRSLVQRWAQLPPSEASPRAAKLAHVLATRAPTCRANGRALFHSLAEQMIGWPIDGRAIDASAFTADCQAVLLLPVAERLEVRVASVQPLAPAEEKPEQSVDQPVPELVLESPAPILSVEATPPPPTASPGSANEPGRFVPGKSQRISDN
jgi:hypothetical protein